MRPEKCRLIQIVRGRCPPNPLGFYAWGLAGRAIKGKNDNREVIALPYKPLGTALRLRPRRALSSDQAPATLRRTVQRVKEMATSTRTQDPCA